MTSDAIAQRRELRAGYRALTAALPVPMPRFTELHEAAFTDAALSRSHKELIAIGISICVGCADCVTLHVHDALAAGATREEVLDAIGVGIAMGGGVASTVAITAVDALDQFVARRT